jgi:RHS repeat-associated protein
MSKNLSPRRTNAIAGRSWLRYRSQRVKARSHTFLLPLATVLLTCGGQRPPPAGDGDVHSIRSSVINPERGPDGKGPLQNLGTHILSNVVPANEPYYESSGTLDATSGVSNGVYTYSIPLRLPEGPGGLKPKLGLAYSSMAGNGPLGVGWSITGLSVISRCGHNVARDGFAAGFDFNPDFNVALNQYCIDGNKLVPTQRSGSTVTYQTESADFAKIEATYVGTQPRDPDYFKVWRRDGLIYFYGYNHSGSSSAESRADGPLGGVTTDPAGGHWTYAWHLTRVEDRDGNSITYSYTRDPGAGYAIANTTATWQTGGASRYLSKIVYGSTWVEFLYESRPDPIEAFAFGFDLSISRRLSEIRINTIGGQPSVKWRYFLRYKQSVFTNRSELSTAQIADRFGRALPATKFKWNSYDRPAGQSSYGDTSDYTITSYALGGACATSQGASTCLPRNSTRVVLTDLDADGRDDVIYSLNDPAAPNGARIKVRISTQFGLGPEVDAVPGLGGNHAVHLDAAIAADFDGDGRAELIWDRLSTVASAPYFPNGLPAARIASRWNGSTLEEVPSSDLKNVLNSWALIWDHNALSGPRPMRVADFNGDGKLDLLGGSMDPNDRAAKQQIYLGKDLNLAFHSPPLPGPKPGLDLSSLFSRTKPFFYGDADGDGRADILATPTVNRKGITFADLNGDGLIEQLDFQSMASQADCGTNRVKFEIKDNFGRVLPWLNPSAPYNYDQTLVVPAGGWGTCRNIGGEATSHLDMDYANSVRVGDFNGDGLQDLLLLNVGLDDGAIFYDRNYGAKATTPALCGRCYNSSGPPIECWEQATRREQGKGHYTHPILLMSTGVVSGPVFVPVVLPRSGWRYREETYATDPSFWEGGECFTGPHRILNGGQWGSHYWNGTAVGDVDGDGLSDVVQIVLGQDGRVQLETITAKKATIGVTSRRDVIVEVFDGLKSASVNGPTVSEIIYHSELATMHAAGTYSRPPAACAPATSPTGTGCLTRGAVVASFKPGGRSAGLLRAIRYSYEGARIDRKGRGFIGFDKTTATDELFGVQTVTSQQFGVRTTTLSDSFGQTAYAASTLVPREDPHFPSFLSWNSGLPSPLGNRLFWPETVTVTKTHSDLVRPNISLPEAPLRRVVTETTNEIVAPVPNSPADVVHVRPKTKGITEIYIEKATSASATKAPDVVRTVDYVYDSYNNQKSVTTATVGGVKNTAYATYNNDPATWLIGLPNHSEHTRENATSNIKRITDYFYWPNGRLKSVIIEPSGTADLKLTTDYAYYSNGNLQTETVTGIDAAISATAPQVRRTSYTYEPQGIFPYQSTNALNQVTTFTYDLALGLPISVVDPNGIGTDYVYDGFGRLKGEIPDGGQAFFIGLVAANLATEQNLAYRQSTWISVANANCPVSGRLIGGDRCFVERDQATVDLLGNVVSTSTRGFETQAMNGQWWDTKYQYDPRNRLVIETKAMARGDAAAPPATSRSYDGLDRLTVFTNPDSSSRTWQYPDRFRTRTLDETDARIVTTVDPDDQVVLTEETVANATGTGTHLVSTSLVRDGFGNPTTTTVTDGSGATRVVARSYDKLGRHINTTEPTSGPLHFRYNAFGELRREEDSVTLRNLTHDALGRPTRRADVNDSSKYDSYDWDTGAGSGIGKLGFTRSMPDNVVQEYGYNDLGQLNRRVLTIGSVRYQLNFQFDSEGRPSKTYFPQPPIGVSGQLKTINTYEGYGRLSDVSMYNPTAASLWKLTRSTPLQTIEVSGDNTGTSYLMDATTRRLSQISHSLSGVTPPLRTVDYTYHADGNVKTRVFAGKTERYDYDELDRLKLWTHTAGSTSFRREYSYNDFGDLLGTRTLTGLTGSTASAQETYTFGVVSPRAIPSAVAGDGSNTYAYDILGRRRTRTPPGAPSSPETISYNHWDLPTSIESPQGIGLSFKYDALGQRVLKIYSGESTYYVDDIFEDRVTSGGSAHTFVMRVKAGDQTVALASQPTAASAPITMRYPHQDALQSTTLVTTGSPSLATFYYEPFGARVAVDGKSPVGMDSNEHQDFAGHERDQLGYINMKGRIYDPALRRFVSPDPLASAPTRSQGHNPFSYVRNNPTNLIDPSGYAGEPASKGKLPDGKDVEQPAHDETDADIYVDENGNLMSVKGNPEGLGLNLTNHGPVASGETPSPGAAASKGADAKAASRSGAPRGGAGAGRAGEPNRGPAQPAGPTGVESAADRSVERAMMEWLIGMKPLRSSKPAPKPMMDSANEVLGPWSDAAMAEMLAQSQPEPTGPTLSETVTPKATCKPLQLPRPGPKQKPLSDPNEGPKVDRDKAKDKARVKAYHELLKTIARITGGMPRMELNKNTQPLPELRPMQWGSPTRAR